MLYDEASFDEETRDDVWSDDDPFAEDTAADAWDWIVEDDPGW